MEQILVAEQNGIKKKGVKKCLELIELISIIIFLTVFIAPFYFLTLINLMLLPCHNALNYL